MSGKQDYVDGAIPTTNEMTQYLQDVANIRNTLTVLSTTPQTPTSMDALNYVKANNIEQILLDVNSLVSKMLLSGYYCNEAYAGEV